MREGTSSLRAGSLFQFGRERIVERLEESRVRLGLLGAWKEAAEAKKPTSSPAVGRYGRGHALIVGLLLGFKRRKERCFQTPEPD